MEFCPKCGSVLIEKGEKYRCARCSYIAKGKVTIKSSEKIQNKEGVGVIREKDVDIMPKTTAVCPKCKNGEAYFWSTQTRSADESETRFFRCVKCKHTWREYR